MTTDPKSATPRTDAEVETIGDGPVHPRAYDRLVALARNLECGINEAHTKQAGAEEALLEIRDTARMLDKITSELADCRAELEEKDRKWDDARSLTGSGPDVLVSRELVREWQSRLTAHAEREGAVPEGESRWLIERTYAKGCPAERREFWLGVTGESISQDSFDANNSVWTIDALQAARFSSQKIAETLRYAHFHPEAPVEACEHLFQCGISPAPSAASGLAEAWPRAEVLHIAFLSKDRADTEGYFAKELLRLDTLRSHQAPVGEDAIREECAKVCERVQHNFTGGAPDWQGGCIACAKAIREL